MKFKGKELEMNIEKTISDYLEVEKQIVSRRKSQDQILKPILEVFLNWLKFKGYGNIYSTKDMLVESEAITFNTIDDDYSPIEIHLNWFVSVEHFDKKWTERIDSEWC